MKDRMPPSPNIYLHVYLLGTFRIDINAQSIRLPTRKVESLLAYLILHPGIHTREKLATLFWGDSSDVAARGSLRKALTILRKHIDAEIILANRDSVQLNESSPVRVDAIEFQRSAREFLAGSTSNPVPIDLYQGDLLRDFYDDWIVPLREHYQKLYLEVLFRAVEQSRMQSEYKLAGEYAKRILETDPANERAHQHLMFCYITLGDRNKALQQSEACQRALDEELAVEPTRETRALYQWIKQTESETPSLAARLTNLPIPISSFVGRNKELARIKQLLSNARLVTLTGAGGSGKTRLAIHASTDLIDMFKDGVWWVDLASLSDNALVPVGVAKSLGVNAPSDQAMTEILEHFLRTKQILLVLDNCEHLIDACARLTETLLTSCAGLKILATSREALSLTGEYVWQVPALSLPDVPNITLINLLMQYEGIRLFVERAMAVNSDFAPNDENAIAIAQICQFLDGIPLAIELAAARIKTISIGEISNGLKNRFQLLTAQNRTAQIRHRTLRAAVDWSYDLLSDDERRLFCRLSVFSGGWTPDAAESACSGGGIEENNIPNLLARLVDKSLITVSADGQRYGMLETMRQYGDEELILSGEQGRVFQRHLDYYLKMAEAGDEKIRGPEQIRWHKWFRSEQDNLAGAIEKALGSPATLEKGCQLVCAMCWHWGMTGDFVTMKHWLEIVLPRSAELQGTATRARVLFLAGSFSVWGLKWLGPQEAKTLIVQSLEIWRALGSDFSLEKTQCLMTLGFIQSSFLNDEKGFEHLNESVDVFQKSNNTWWHAWALNLSVTTVLDSDDPKEIRRIWEDETVLWRKAGDRWGEAQPLVDMGGLALERGEFVEAEKHLLKSLQIFREFESKGYLIQILPKLGDTARGLNQYDRAKEFYEDSIPLASAIMWDFSLSQIYFGLGYVALHNKDAEQAEKYFHEALKVSQEYNLSRRRILCLAGFASAAAVRGDAVTATRHFGAFFSQLENLQTELNTDQKLLDPAEQIEIDNYLSLCKSQNEPRVFEKVWKEGSCLSLNEVIDEIVKKNS